MEFDDEEVHGCAICTNEILDEDETTTIIFEIRTTAVMFDVHDICKDAMTDEMATDAVERYFDYLLDFDDLPEC